MGSVHELITRVGVEEARRRVPTTDRKIVDTAAAVLATESRAMGITYAGFCLTSLPHNELPDDQIWERHGHRVKLVVEPGRLPDHTGNMRLYGVPYGSRARMIMIYLQSRAIQTNSPEVELGQSMYEWMTRMGISDGGKQYRQVREQADRISACHLTFVWSEEQGQRQRFSKDSIVKDGIQLSSGDPKQLRLWVDTVRLSDSFFKALKEHPVPVWEPAMKLISSKSMSIDLYVWLAYRLHVLTEPTPITWAALYAQFGFSYQNLKHFKPRFIESLKMATAVYPEANVEVNEKGLVLRPSAPPIPQRKLLG
ncbi:replication protein RepA [Azospirillum sp.]|uniref:replication protein RepA n=1 Tax=Azospirillum sp. TaxID=34012 RepID=UPI002D397D85|nr:replication protein RepA [Azospirillum sp.]HYD64767.1 replication protein RepA [Azospirillum sp.]